MLERFDVSHEFWEQFGVRKENTRKQLGLYEIKHIEDPCFVTIATNPKEYIKYFQSQGINKRYKRIRKSENSINLESFAEKIDSLREIEEYKDRRKIKEKTVAQTRFAVKKKRNGFGNCPKKNLVN